MLEYINEVIRNTEVTNATVIFKLGLSLILGMAVGIERQVRKRDAGIRTFTLICVGSTAAMLVSIWVPQSYPHFLNVDPGRIAAQVLTGIGFLGAGAIIHGRGSIYGLTTAACIWVISAVGLAVGAGLYVGAIVATLVTLFILISMEHFEKRLFLDGENKMLIINCRTTCPDLDRIREILRSKKIVVINLSFEYNYDKQTTSLTYKVSVKSRTNYPQMFEEVAKLGYVSEIKLLA